MLTNEQQNFKNAVTENPEKSFILQALAGTGKTFTLLEACPTDHAVLALAFNKRIANELQDKFPANADCMTFNGFGHRTWSKYLGRRPQVNTSKTYQITKDLLEEIGEEWAWKNMSDLMNLVGMAKTAGIVPSDTTVQHICLTPDDPQVWYDMCDDEDYDTRLIELAREILRRSIKEALVGIIDFADQLYMPVVFRAPWPRGKYPTMIIDEAQDLNPLQHEMIRLTQKKGRIIAAGDRKQAIYGWRGATENSMDELKEMFSAEEFPLTLTWRCPKAVVQTARRWAPAYTAADSAAEGSVTNHGFDWEMHQITSDSVILCRNNKHLFILAMKMMAAGISCRMEGRDIGKGLKRIVNDLIKSNNEEVEILLKKVKQWADNKIANYNAKVISQRLQRSMIKPLPLKQFPSRPRMPRMFCKSLTIYSAAIPPRLFCPQSTRPRGWNGGMFISSIAT
jgi:DNA helicase II / ATP-dependent DNA helicase PcrA